MYKSWRDYCIDLIAGVIKHNQETVEKIKQYGFSLELEQDLWNELLSKNLLADLSGVLLFQKVKKVLQKVTIDYFVEGEDFLAHNLAERIYEELLGNSLLSFGWQEENLPYPEKKMIKI